MPDPVVHRPSRRSVLRRGGAACAVCLGAGVAGCLGGSEPTETPDAERIGPDATCETCGMIIGDHPGANGQVFYAEHEPGGHPSPGLFDALAACLFPFHHDKDARGWEATAIYVTDYSAVDYELFEREGTTYVSSHLEPASFAPAESVTYVVGSAVHGAMGPDFVPFSAAGDADALVAEYGGERYAFEDLGPDVWNR